MVSKWHKFWKAITQACHASSKFSQKPATILILSQIQMQISSRKPASDTFNCSLLFLFRAQILGREISWFLFQRDLKFCFARFAKSEGFLRSTLWARLSPGDWYYAILLCLDYAILSHTLIAAAFRKRGSLPLVSRNIGNFEQWFHWGHCG